MNGGSQNYQTLPKILALDTSSPNVSLALCQGREVIALIGLTGIAPHSRTLFRHLKYLLESAETGLEQIDLFAVVTGPGSFTGLRVGISAAKGLARGCGRPLIGVTAFDAWASAAGSPGAIAVLLEAGRGQVYFGLRSVDADGRVQTLGTDRVIGLQEISSELLLASTADRLTIIGNVDLRAISISTASINNSDEGDAARAMTSNTLYLAQHAGAVAWRRFGGGEVPEAHPYYIKPADAEMMRGGGR
jgi:tRNA threonylcarbamoyladenosine biosynthesis protein TsaB